MAEFEFGKLDFSTSFNPTSAFPIDARCLFADYESALAAAKTAEMPGSKNTKYYIGQKLLVVTETTSQWYKITSKKTLEAEGSGSSSMPGGECQVEFATDEEVGEMLDGVFGTITS